MGMQKEATWRASACYKSTTSAAQNIIQSLVIPGLAKGESYGAQLRT
jgi:hypothetical protein